MKIIELTCGCVFGRDEEETILDEKVLKKCQHHAQESGWLDCLKAGNMTREMINQENKRRGK